MNELKAQDTAAPTRKVAASGIGGALVVVALVVLGAFGVDLPIAVEDLPVTEAITAIVMFVTAYMARERA